MGINPSGSYVNPDFKSVPSTPSQPDEYKLAYSPDQVMHFKCYGGKYTTIFTDIVEASIDYEVEFFACTDPDGRTYNVVKIGDQFWMEENLAYLPEMSVSTDGSSTVPFYYVYNYRGSSIIEAKNTDYYKRYGVLYNWDAANISCPRGWHLPTDEEYKILERYLGMSITESNSNAWHRGPGVDDKMKSVSGWSQPDITTNKSGFNLVPAGLVRYERMYYTYGAGNLSELWCSSSHEEGHHISRLFLYNADGICKWNWPNSGGFSVRCIKNE